MGRGPRPAGMLQLESKQETQATQVPVGAAGANCGPRQQQGGRRGPSVLPGVWFVERAHWMQAPGGPLQLQHAGKSSMAGDQQPCTFCATLPVTNPAAGPAPCVRPRDCKWRRTVDSLYNGVHVVAASVVCHTCTILLFTSRTPAAQASCSGKLQSDTTNSRQHLPATRGCGPTDVPTAGAQGASLHSVAAVTCQQVGEAVGHQACT